MQCGAAEEKGPTGFMDLAGALRMPRKELEEGWEATVRHARSAQRAEWNRLAPQQPRCRGCGNLPRPGCS